MAFKNLKLLLILAATILSSPSIQASSCDNFDNEPEYFKSIYNRARALGTEICLSYGTTIEYESLVNQYTAFANHISEQTAITFRNKSFSADMVVQMKLFSDLAKRGVDKSKLPSFVTMSDDSDLDSTGLFFQFSSSNTMGRVDLAAEECKAVDKNPGCKALFESLAVAIEQYKKPYSSMSGDELSQKTEVLTDAWNQYFDVARSQTLLDALLTSALELDHLAQDRLVGPMPRQWFAIHPSIIIENVSSAVDGDQLAEALAIEWIGVNWWDENSSPIGYPVGISLASIYSDRSNVDDVGHGLMIHIDNTVSIGWADHGGDNGFYVTFDFLNVFAEKKQRWNDYRDKIKELTPLD